MSKETDWVETWVQQLEQSLRQTEGENSTIRAEAQKKLNYAYEIQRYTSENKVEFATNVGYKTDVTIFDQYEDQTWTPRVVVEAKLTRINSHDALTYSSKAATHKHVHPYLRYGVILGGFANYGVPVRLFRHGAFFDFMLTWCLDNPEPDEWNDFVEILWSEVQTSRQIQTMLLTNRKGSKNKIVYRKIHRPLILTR